MASTARLAIPGAIALVVQGANANPPPLWEEDFTELPAPERYTAWSDNVELGNRGRGYASVLGAGSAGPHTAPCGPRAPVVGPEYGDPRSLPHLGRLRRVLHPFPLRGRKLPHGGASRLSCSVPGGAGTEWGVPVAAPEASTAHRVRGRVACCHLRHAGHAPERDPGRWRGRRSQGRQDHPGLRSTRNVWPRQAGVRLGCHLTQLRGGHGGPTQAGAVAGHRTRTGLRVRRCDGRGCS